MAKVNKLEDRSKKIMKKQADGLDALATKLSGGDANAKYSQDLNKLCESLSEQFTDLTSANDIPFNGEIRPPKITVLTPSKKTTPGTTKPKTNANNKKL